MLSHVPTWYVNVAHSKIRRILARSKGTKIKA